MMMTLRDLADLVADMRRAQKEYFRTRSLSALGTSKCLEQRVDKAIEGVIRQPGLFPDEDEL